MLPAEYEERLKELMRIFLEENKKLNLSAFRTEEDCWIGNILDSLSYLDLNLEGETILDLGTGGGFPLLPLAICLPETKLIGLDSTQKKIDAVQRIVDQMDLKNVTLHSGRTEELGHDEEHREQYDVVTARALAPLNILIEFAAPFVKVGGKIVAWKSAKLTNELQDSLMARAELSCQLIESHEYELPEKWGKRQLLIFEKRFATKEKYSRDVGVPKKNPLL